MSLWALVLTALAVSADAFVVALGRGTCMRTLDLRAAAGLAAVFGGFQAGMPLVGWLVGTGVSEQVQQLDHWIAFGLLLLVGGKMLGDNLRPGVVAPVPVWCGRVVLALGVATSIDALAVGVGLALVDVPILLAVMLIGATTFVLSCGGVVIGQRAGQRHRRLAGLLGGGLLVALGVRVLVDGLRIA